MATKPATKKNYSKKKKKKNRKYQLAATLESEDGNHTAYVIGNVKELIKGKSNCTVKDGGSCLPYDI